jgi:NADH-quinone oxidoreductase subunit H
MEISAQTFVSILVGLGIVHLFLGLTAYLIYVERKIASYAQDRIGPNRVGFTFGFGNSAKKRHLGLGQPLADGIKFLIKEDYNPRNVDKALFMLAPALAVIPALIGWAVIPWGGAIDHAGSANAIKDLWIIGPLLDVMLSLPLYLPMISDIWVNLYPIKITPGTAVITAADINIGVIYILAIGSLAVYGVILGAWASNNKFAFFGGLRGTAQMLSYEIPMGICVLCILLTAGSSRAFDIVATQLDSGTIWYFVQQPLACVLFFTCVLAECNRAPFDLPEAESELVGGYHTEYSSMKFALFFLGEYMHMLTGAAFTCVLFLGGWHVPFEGFVFGLLGIADDGVWAALIRTGNFIGKITLILCVMMWIRWTLPRFRFDQLMRLAWRSMIPLSLGLLLMTGTWVYLGWESWLWAGNIGVFAVGLLVMPLIPEGPALNRRVGLEGSRFSPVES